MKTNHAVLFSFGPLLVALLLVTVSAEAEEGLSAGQIMAKNYSASRVQDSIGLGTLVLYNARGQQRVRQTKTVSKLAPNGVEQKRLIRFLRPEDVAGTGVLTIEHSGADDDMWIYLPALRKVRRLAAQDRSNAFMGSEFSYADILPREVRDYRHNLLKRERLSNVDCYVVESTPANSKVQDEDGYGKRVSWIRADNFMEIRVDLYNERGELWKRMTTSKLREVDTSAQKWVAGQRVMDNLKTKCKSVLIISKIRVNTGVPDSVFTTGNLERGQ